MNNKTLRRWVRFWILAAGLVALSGCGGGGNSPRYTLGGSVKGLNPGEEVALIDGAGRSVTVSANGTFSFPVALASGSSYAVEVSTQPTGQTCDVVGGSGTIGSLDVSNVTVSCANNFYSVGGTMTGTNGVPGIVLANGTDTLAIPPNTTSFSMPARVENGTTYNVIVQTSPLAVKCSVANGTGKVNAANVTNISVSCVPATVSTLYSFAGGTSDGSSPKGGLIQASNGDFYGMTPQGGASNDGVVFEMNPGGTETVLHSFSGGSTDGSTPYGDLIQANDGDFYGMTFQGGASNDGVIFEIAADGTETVLHSFSGGLKDGRNPYGSLIQATDGDFYGMATVGGAGSPGTGVVFKMTPGGVVSILYSFNGGTTDGYYPEGSLIQASDGSFYGMTSQGGSSNDGVVFKVTAGGTETVLHSFGGGATDGALPFGSLIQASNGDFYGTTSQGGPNNDGVVFQITPSGKETILHFFAGGTADGSDSDDLIQASDGNFYGTAWGGGQSDVGVLFMISPDGDEFVFHSFIRGTQDGFYPGVSLVQAKGGPLYGVTDLGGANSDGTVFEVH